MSRDQSSPAMDLLEQYAVHLGAVIRLDPQQAGLMILVKSETDPTFGRMIAQYIEHVMGLRLVENIAATPSGWRQLGVILNGPTIMTHQQVFGELTWRPESALKHVSMLEGRGSLTGGLLLVGCITLMVGLFAACTPDYVYIRDGQSEATVRQDYINCTEQQFKASNSTTECMENKGYKAAIIERTFSESPHSLSSSPLVSR